MDQVGKQFLKFFASKNLNPQNYICRSIASLSCTSSLCSFSSHLTDIPSLPCRCRSNPLGHLTQFYFQKHQQSSVTVKEVSRTFETKTKHSGDFLSKARSITLFARTHLRTSGTKSRYFHTNTTNKLSLSPMNHEEFENLEITESNQQSDMTWSKRKAIFFTSVSFFFIFIKNIFSL